MKTFPQQQDLIRMAGLTSHPGETKVTTYKGCEIYKYIFDPAQNTYRFLVKENGNVIAQGLYSVESAKSTIDEMSGGV